MHGAFLFIREELFEFFICLFWCASFHNSHTVHHTMDVRIDPDKGHIVEMGEDDFCRFHTDSWQCADGFESVRYFSAVFVHEFFCGHEEVFCFHSVIVHTLEHGFYFFWIQFEEVVWSFHELEESFCCFIDSFICHLCREHDGCEELKRCFKIELDSSRRVESHYCLEDFIPLGFRSDFHDIHGKEVFQKCKNSWAISVPEKIIAKYLLPCYNRSNEEKNTASFLPGEADSLYSMRSIFFVVMSHFPLLRPSIPRLSVWGSLRRSYGGGDTRRDARRFSRSPERCESEEFSHATRCTRPRGVSAAVGSTKSHQSIP